MADKEYDLAERTFQFALSIRLLGVTSAKETVKDQLRKLFSEADELVRILATTERKSSGSL